MNITVCVSMDDDRLLITASSSHSALSNKLDDTSPQISYISATHGWLTNHTNGESCRWHIAFSVLSRLDNIAPQYFDGTFHGTYTQVSSSS